MNAKLKMELKTIDIVSPLPFFILSYIPRNAIYSPHFMIAQTPLYFKKFMHYLVLINSSIANFKPSTVSG